MLVVKVEEEQGEDEYDVLPGELSVSSPQQT